MSDESNHGDAAAVALIILALISILLAFAPTPARAQRCPAGQDQFMNCLSMNPQMRAKQEQWANQPAARQIPGAQPYGASGGRPTTNPCVYRKAMQSRDPRMVRLAAETARRGNTVEAANTLRNTADYEALQRKFFRECAARGQ
jgi:hypothetical protein